MFYSDEFSSELRLGDIVKGFTHIRPKVNELENIDNIVNIEFQYSLCAILSPCCSIEKGHVLIAPLKKIESQWLNNNYFIEDFTLINSPMMPWIAAGDKVWGQLSEEIKQTRLKIGLAYSYLDNFIYAESALLPTYDLSFKKHSINTGNYMIDFNDVCCFKCDSISRGNDQLINHKLMELSIETRNLLRNKLTYFFERKPEEDQLLD